MNRNMSGNFIDSTIIMQLQTLCKYIKGNIYLPNANAPLGGGALESCNASCTFILLEVITSTQAIYARKIIIVMSCEVTRCDTEFMNYSFYTVVYSILRGRIKGTACSVILHTAPECLYWL